ncbi:glycoside hydrolase 43 family protein [uncultured Caulobacter sp.]|uniref:glycoside hydrolase family 43 protein n=1 Tax=uncultured Caulobacter sp. TaxID=158749 RepID=UPI0026023E27|nr:glycoside hydrolase 43 family protein [uncultured Caulobacter sp.]
MTPRPGLLGVLCAAGLLLSGPTALARPQPTDGRWFADRGETFVNPVLIGDYSDPDVIRVGRDYYLTASSFNSAPGLPILRSGDLVNWTLIGHALPWLSPRDHFRAPRRGAGVWAPSLRHHAGLYMIYYPDPDHGLFRVTAKDPRGPWTAPTLVDSDPGAIDPAPFWDDDGHAWLVHAYAKSRSGKANIIMLKPLSPDGARVTGKGRVIIDGDRLPPIQTSVGPRPWLFTEGPKLYKRNGWYYLFAPSGGVKAGWQAVFRSRSLTGPFEPRNVMDQGDSQTNGPHQGAWVVTDAGEDWFLHFEDRDVYGRVVHLEPMAWKDDWPVIGADPDGDGRGAPVAGGRKPRTLAPVATRVAAPVADDPLTGAPNLAWQWAANPADDWMRPSPEGLWLKSISGSANLFETGAVLSQKLPAEAFTATVRLDFAPKAIGERAGLGIFGRGYGWIGLEKTAEGPRLVVETRPDADRNGEAQTEARAIAQSRLWLRVTATPRTLTIPPTETTGWPSLTRWRTFEARYSYSLDGQTFTPFGPSFTARPGVWVGAQIGLFAQARQGAPAAVAAQVGGGRFADFRVTP